MFIYYVMDKEPVHINILLQKWGAYCLKLSKCHEACRIHLRKYNFGIMIPAIFLASASGVGTIGASKDAKCSVDYRTNWVTIGFGIATIASSAMMTIHRYMMISDLQKEHDLYSDIFKNLANEVVLQLALSGTQYVTFRSMHEFAKYFKRQMDVHIEKSPAIYGWVKRKFDLEQQEIEPLSLLEAVTEHHVQEREIKVNEEFVGVVLDADVDRTHAL